MENKEKEESKEKEVKRGVKIVQLDRSLGGYHISKADPCAVAYDIVVPEDTWVPRGRSVIGTKLRMSLPIGVEGKIEARSGFSAKGIEGYPVNRFGRVNRNKKLRFDADVITGKIDPGYHGEIGIIVRNNGRRFVVPAMTRLAQLTFYAFEKPYIRVVDQLTGYDRNGGFGHTGTTANTTDKE